MYANSIVGVALKNNTKVLDAALVSHDIKWRYPLVVVEIGFTETLDRLFNDATWPISGSSGKIDVVILIKVFEANRHLKDEFLWGIEQHNIASLWELDESDSLAPQILSYYETWKLKVISDLNVEIYWYPKTRKSKPTKPIYVFWNDPQNTPNGSFMMSKHFGIEIKSNSFDLLVAELEHKFSHGIAKEHNGWISKLIQKAGVWMIGGWFCLLVIIIILALKESTHAWPSHLYEQFLEIIAFLFPCWWWLIST